MARVPTVVLAPVFVFALATGGLACTSVVARQPQSVSEQRRGAGAQVLLWATAAEDALPSTYAVTGDGTVVGRSDGIRIWASGTEWTSAVSVEAIPTQACEGGPDRPAQEGRGVRVRMIPSDTSRSPIELVTPSNGDLANEIEQSARVLASLGPYVFVEESTYAYTCGAHGNTGVSFAVWNLDEGRTVDLLSELPDREHLLAAGKQAIDARPDAVDFSRPEDPPMVTELLPDVGAHGQLEASALVTVATCYACTQGGWSSYTASTQVPVPLPWRLQALGPPPRAVALFAAAHRGLTIGGYSVVR